MIGSSKENVQIREIPLTISGMLKLAEENGIGQTKLREGEKQYLLRQQYLEEQKIEHQATGALSGSRNEVGDSRDLDSSESETTLYKIDYKQTLENGIYWKISHQQRFEKAITGDGTDGQLNKTVLSALVPFYGKSSYSKQLNREKIELSMNRDRNQWRSEHRKWELKIATLFLEWYLQKEEKKKSDHEIRRHQEQLKRITSSPNLITALEVNQLELKILQQKQRREKSAFLAKKAKEQLVLLAGATLEYRVPVLNEIPKINRTLEELSEQYLLNSVKLQSLRSQIQIKENELQSKELETLPDFQAGAFYGQSQATSASGKNWGVNLSVTYRFGSGHLQQFGIAQQEKFKLELELQEERKSRKQQALEDWQTLELNEKMLEINRMQYQLAREEEDLVKKNFRVGTAMMKTVAKAEIKTRNMQTEITKSVVEQWKTILKILEQTDEALIPFFEASQN